MASDQEIAKGVEALLRQSDPNAVISLNGVVQQLEAKLGLDLSHKAGFINDQINLLRSPQPPQQQTPLQSRDHFALLHHQQFPSTQPEQFYPHFALHQQQHYQHNTVPLQPPPQQLRPAVLQQHVPPQAPPPTVVRLTASQNVVQNAAPSPKERFDFYVNSSYVCAYLTIIRARISISVNYSIMLLKFPFFHNGCCS